MVQNSTCDHALFPLFGFDFVQRTFLPLARLRFKTALPPVVLIRLRKPCVRASDFRDLDLFVMQSTAFPALTTRRWDLCFTTLLHPKSMPKDNPEDQIFIIVRMLQWQLVYTYLFI